MLRSPDRSGLTDDEAYRFVLAFLLMTARGDEQGLVDLVGTVPEWNVPTYTMVARHALSVAFAAHVALAASLGEKTEDWLQRQALTAAQQ